MTFESQMAVYVKQSSNEDIETKGYFLMASQDPVKIGEIITNMPYLGHPVVVIAVAEKEEFCQQQQRAAAKFPRYAYLFILVPEYEYFYKVTAE